MRVAIVGGGVSGNVTAWLLSQDHDITLFEAADYLGGHTNTIDVEAYGEKYTVDTGFMVFNDRTYPEFCRLLDQLGVASRDSDMSFSVRCERTGLEYQGSSLDGLFAQRMNLFNPRFYQMLGDVLRFNRTSIEFLNQDDDQTTLGDYLTAEKYGRRFIECYLVPMTAAIWSARPDRVLDMPARFLIAFFQNHGLLRLRDRPQWKTVVGGARSYVAALTASFQNRIRLSTPIQSVVRGEDHVIVKPVAGEAEVFDEVVFACHADQTLAILEDPTEEEQRILGHFEYQLNRAIVHTDESLLPKRRRAWASWNYHIPAKMDSSVTVTYDLNRLQGLEAPGPICVTLNDDGCIDEETVLESMDYHHPVFGPGTLAAQNAHSQISGRRRTHFCGAYWGYGFHEDGVRSALKVAKSFNIGPELCEVASTRGSSGTVVSSR